MYSYYIIIIIWYKIIIRWDRISFKLIIILQMYNGIGLQTARGSGTSGYVQKNLSYNVKKLETK